MGRGVRRAYRFANPMQRKFFLVTRLILIANVLMFMLALIIIVEVLS